KALFHGFAGECGPPRLKGPRVVIRERLLAKAGTPQPVGRNKRGALHRFNLVLWTWHGGTDRLAAKRRNPTRRNALRLLRPTGLVVFYSLTYFVTPLTVASAVYRLPAASMAIPSPIAPSGESVLCGGTNVVTLPSFKLPMRIPLSQPGCTRGVDSESAT